MLLSDTVGSYFTDLEDKVVSALALVHQNFSTNTFPSWDLAQPFRMICHNGEINTLRGNVNWMNARKHMMSSKFLGEDLKKIWPIISEGQSDSACFDNALELLIMGGYTLSHAMMLLIPEAWQNNKALWIKIEEHSMSIIRLLWNHGTDLQRLHFQMGNKLELP